MSKWFSITGEVLVCTIKEEEYGRMLADCYLAGEANLSTELLERVLWGCYDSVDRQQGFTCASIRVLMYFCS